MPPFFEHPPGFARRFLHHGEFCVVVHQEGGGIVEIEALDDQQRDAPEQFVRIKN